MPTAADTLPRLSRGVENPRPPGPPPPERRAGPARAARLPRLRARAHPPPADLAMACSPLEALDALGAGVRRRDRTLRRRLARLPPAGASPGPRRSRGSRQLY